jgi:hypothetical protein
MTRMCLNLFYYINYKSIGISQFSELVTSEFISEVFIARGSSLQADMSTGRAVYGPVRPRAKLSTVE